MAAAPKTNITRIDPTNWYVGMKNPKLQLMVYGPNIAAVKNVTTDYPGVTIDEVVRLDSPNYLLVYLDLSGAQPGEMTLQFDKKKFKYQLKQREMSGDKREGFTNADVLYMLMPDRFASGRSDNDQIKGLNTYVNDRSQPSLRHGGDLEGIRQHLDYFNELGVTALWFTPVLENNSPDNNRFSTYHGYATTDYYRVDPRFGSNEEYRQLIDEAHQKGLKIVMDMIFNHCGFEHPWVADMPSPDWFNTPEWLSEKQSSGRDPLTGFTANADGSEPAKSQYLQTSYKLTPVKDPYASEIDLHETVDGWWNGLNRLYNSFCYDYLYEDPNNVMAFIDNHDTDRFLGNGKDSLALKQALALLLTVKRIPQIYYGTEILMNGTKEVTDGNVRKDFPGGFPGDKHNAFTAEGRTKAENAMFNWLSALLHWRNGNETIIRGYQTQFIPYHGIYVVARRWHRHGVMTILNGTSKPAVMEINRYAELFDVDQTEAEDVITGRKYSLKKDIKLSPRQTLILEY